MLVVNWRSQNRMIDLDFVVDGSLTGALILHSPDYGSSILD
jgi:hypothetical protein